VTQVLIKWEKRPSSPAADRLRRVIAGCLESVGRSESEVHLLITGDDRIRALNRRYRDIDRATDVLSFPDGDLLPSGVTLLGEIVISLDTARRQARELGHDELRELAELALHGVLHLLGYDHDNDRGPMNALEIELREEIVE
jgi:probable rRNA maturation factor